MEVVQAVGLLLLHGMNFKFYRRKAGMSLAEVMMATTFLSVVLVTLIGTMTGGLEALQKGTNYNQANIIANRTIEDYKTMDYGTLCDSNSTVDGFDVKVKVNTGTYNFNSLTESYKQVIVEVSNKEYMSKNKKKGAYVKMETIFIKLD